MFRRNSRTAHWAGGRQKRACQMGLGLQQAGKPTMMMLAETIIQMGFPYTDAPTILTTKTEICFHHVIQAQVQNTASDLLRWPLPCKPIAVILLGHRFFLKYQVPLHLHCSWKCLTLLSEALSP